MLEGSLPRRGRGRIPGTLTPMKETESAAAMLLAAGIEPRRLLEYLPRVDPATVLVRVAPGWFRRLWARGIVAMALPRGVYVQPEVMTRFRAGTDPDRTGRLIVHELTHIEQWRRLGALKHLTQYIADYLRGRFTGKGHWDSYRQVRLEVEARLVASRIAGEGAR
jgi:hypothetical protein